jgi:hypothetical protein
MFSKLVSEPVRVFTLDARHKLPNVRCPVTQVLVYCPLDALLHGEKRHDAENQEGHRQYREIPGGQLCADRQRVHGL